MTEPLPLPGPIRDYLVRLLETRWSGRDSPPPIDDLPDAMPAEKVSHLAGRGPFGWLIEARLDEVDGRLALECLEDSRMAGPDHYRVWEDGTREELPNERIEYSYPTGCSPEELERIKAEYYAHNRAVQAQLRERGFGPH